MKKLLILLIFSAFIGSFITCGDEEEEYVFTCKIDGVSKTFKSKTGFSLDKATWSVVAESGNDVMIIYVPNTDNLVSQYTTAISVKTGFAYKTSSDYYYPDFYTKSDQNFNLTITSWANGKASGTFKGKAANSTLAGASVMTISDGAFTGVKYK